MPTLALPNRQLELLSVQPVFNIASNAHARNAYGAAAQEIVCAALGLASIPIDGRKEICFDAADLADDARPYEIKSVHRNAKIVIYDWRMVKEALVPQSRYIILQHRVRSHRDGHTLYRTFAESGLEAWIVSTQTVHRIAAEEPKRVLLAKTVDPRNGYNRKGYRDGYRNVPMSKFRSLLVKREVRAFDLYGIPFCVTIRVEENLKEKH